MFVGSPFINMGLSEFGVLYIVEKLVKNGEPINPVTVASIGNCNPETVRKVFALWRERGEMVMTGTPRGGYVYKLVRPTDRGTECS